jgi:hypothetical protein
MTIHSAALRQVPAGGTAHAPYPGWRFQLVPIKLDFHLSNLFLGRMVNELRGEPGFTDKCVESVERPPH